MILFGVGLLLGYCHKIMLLLVSSKSCIQDSFLQQQHANQRLACPAVVQLQHYVVGLNLKNEQTQDQKVNTNNMT